MSDSFADLWSSTAPSKPASQKIGALSSNPPLNRPKNDVFSLLSAASSQPNSRPLTPSTTTPKPASTSSASGDAFSNLLGGSFSSSNANNLTIAERAAKAERERREASLRSQQMAPKGPAASAWDGLDSLGQMTSSKQSSAQPEDDDWGFGPVATPQAPPSKAATPAVEDDWGLGDFSSVASASKPAPKVPSASSRTQSLWDMNEFSDSPASLPNPLAEEHQSSLLADFGSQEQSLFSTDDDILGPLSQAVTSKQSPPPKPKASSRTASPPPHILGQLVEMGFSIPQAKSALAATESGIDVQAALETLLANGSVGQTPPPQHPRTSVRASEGRRASPQQPIQQSERPSPATDKLFAQASEIGLSLFSKANAVLKEGSKRVQQAYLETLGDTASPAEGEPRTKGAPKWMQQRQDERWDDESEHRPSDGFSDGVEPLPRKPSRPGPASSIRTTVEPEVDLISAGEPSSFISSYRRKQPSTSSPATTSRTSPVPQRILQPRPNIVSASLSSISQSQSHKSVGGDKFKLGQYAEAESAYTRAIDCLPARHLLLVHLYNNRALVRMKIGEYSSAVDDATTALDIIGESWRKGIELPVTTKEEGSEVDLADGLVKGWKRRAEAFEGKEKWDEARKDWEKVAGADWASRSLRNEGVRGAGRCRRTLDQANGVSSTKPKAATPRPPPRTAAKPSQALSDLRKVTNAAEAEDQAKHDLKDVVDLKVNAWKGGKETNIRALLGSLDTVLWPELGLAKSSMADLISPSQVKIRYTKTIAKLHPDKLNERNSTLEQRMVANAVFGTLNEAWNAFKQ
ncbi:hypothetical protein C8J56DRAFT_1012708 [Mycena floridula]|nr:hypothetical protein C8J56DRAFT_1012708 [Mycena floridula]